MKKLIYTFLAVSIIFSACEKEEEDLYGCTNVLADNYNDLATIDDGSCAGACIGCAYLNVYGSKVGTVFYLNGNGGGLIAALSDQNWDAGAKWGCYGTEILGADGTAIGTGSQNTSDILAGCFIPNIAADMCVNFANGENGGYFDWFLPSKDELNEMYLNLHQQGLGNFADSWYLSSTEYGTDNNNINLNTNYVWGQSFTINYPGGQDYILKNSYRSVRAVRAF